LNYDIEAVYKKVWPKMQRPLDIGYVNFVVNQYRKGKVLDVGCGFGELLGALREFGFECYGTVASRYEVQECKRKGLGVKFHDASKKFPYPSGFFDLVLSFGSIEHIPGWGNALGEMHRVLKKGGSLIVETPNHSVFRKSEKYQETHDVIDTVHFKEFDFHELKREIEKRGFSGLKAHSKWFYYPSHYAFQMLDAFFPKKHLPYLFFSAIKD